MEDQDLIQDDPPVETPGEDQETEDVLKPVLDSETGDYVYEDGYRVTVDGKHYDADGNEVQGEPETPYEPPVETKPAPQQEQYQQYPQIYTEENLYTPQEQEQLATWDIDDPGKAASYRFQKLQRLRNYAEDRFDTELDALEREAPTMVQRYSREIARARRNMSAEQLQMPGAARNVAALVAAEKISSDPKALERFLTGGAGGGGKPEATPATKGAAEPAGARQRRVLPPEMRVPTPSGQRRAVNTRTDSDRHSDNWGIPKAHVKLLVDED